MTLHHFLLRFVPPCPFSFMTLVSILEQHSSNITMPVEDRGKGARLVTLKKRVHVGNYVVNYGIDKFTCLTNQEYLQHA